MRLFHTARKFLNELVDESFLAYVKSLETRVRGRDGSVQDLAMIRCPTSLFECHQVELELECRLNRFEESTDQFLSTTEGCSLPSELRFYAEIERFQLALVRIRCSFLGTAPRPDLLVALSLKCNTRGWQDSFSLLHAHRLLDSLLYHFRNSALSLILLCGEEHANLPPEQSPNRREEAQRNLATTTHESTWVSLAPYSNFLLSPGLLDAQKELLEHSLQLVQSKVPLLAHILAQGTNKIYVIRETTPAFIESDFISVSGGALKPQHGSSDKYLVLNDWSTEAYCALSDLTERKDGPAVLGSHLIQTLGYLAFIERYPHLPAEVESYPPLQAFCHSLLYLLMDEAPSVDRLARALAEYRPTYEALYLLYAAEEVSPILQQWASTLPNSLETFANNILREEAFGEAWEKTLLYSSSGL